MRRAPLRRCRSRRPAPCGTALRRGPQAAPAAPAGRFRRAARRDRRSDRNRPGRASEATTRSAVRAPARAATALSPEKLSMALQSNGSPASPTRFLKAASSSAARLRLISPVVTTNSASGNPIADVIGAGRGSAWMPMRWLPRRDGQRHRPHSSNRVDVVSALDDGDDGLVGHGMASMRAAPVAQRKRPEPCLVPAMP